MSFTMDSVSVLNPKLTTQRSIPLKNVVECVKFDPLFRTRGCRVSVLSKAASFKGVAAGLLPLNQWRPGTPLVVAFAASHEDSHQEIEVEGIKDEPHIGSAESQEAWKQALDTFREQASKIQSLSQESYELYSKKAIIILQNASEQLKAQADKARHELNVVAKDIGEEGKHYLDTAAETEPVKEIVKTFTSPTDDLSEISGVRDFYVGIPYGFLLFLGGFLFFMVTGSITAIRFGLILGGVLLALSILSLRSFKKGQTSQLALKGQAAIASMLFLRELSLICKGSSLITYFTALISGAVVAFYVYRITLERKRKDPNFKIEAESKQKDLNFESEAESKRRDPNFESEAESKFESEAESKLESEAESKRRDPNFGSEAES